MSVNINYLGERTILGKLPRVAKFSNYIFSCKHTHKAYFDEISPSAKKLSKLAAEILTCIETYEVACTGVRNDYNAGLICKSDRNELLRLIGTHIERDRKLVEIANRTVERLTKKH